MSKNGSHVAAPSLAIAFHSGFGHTATLADAVATGATEAGADVRVIAVEHMAEADWDILDAADGIVFGTATYMGNLSAGFQSFAEQTGRRCLNGTWRTRWQPGSPIRAPRAATSSPTLVSLAVFAAQHHMHWVNLGLAAGWNSSTGSEDDLNRLGFWLGAGAQTDVDAGPRQCAPVRCADVPPPRPAGRAGDAPAQRRPVGYCSGFSSSQHRRHQFADRRVDVHGARQRGVGRLGRHHVEDGVDDLVAADTEDRRAENLVRSRRRRRPS